jgi:hypothetical protein
LVTVGNAAFAFQTSIIQEQFPALNEPVIVAETIVPAVCAVYEGVVPVPTAVPAKVEFSQPKDL